MPKQYGSPTLLMGITMAFFLLITATAPLYAESGGGLTEDGLGTVVTPAGTTFDITGGTRPGGPTGSNLFHSFSQFNVENGETANFIGDSSLTNIFVRVTGGNNSWIDGTIKTTNTNANVYIMNPNGVMFGSNASFDANGSVYVSTADYVKLADDNRFYADVVKTSVLTTAAPAAFGFLATPGGNISVNGSHQLTVAVDKTLSLIGGDLLMDNGATLTAASGQVNLVSVASAGEVDISGTDPVMNGVTAQGDVTIRASSKIDVNGDGGGRVFIRGGNVVLENASIEAKTTGATAGLGVDIAASNTLTFTHSLIDTATGGTGNAGNVILSAADITLDGFGASADEVFIDTRTDGLANAGNITLTATNSITLDASGASAQIRIFADSLATPGLAGDLALNANSIIVQGQELFSLSSTATDAASIGTIGATASTITVDGQEGSLLVDKTGVGGFYVITNVILDGSLGPAQSVAGPAYTVQEAWGTVSGANLFHSAKKFIVDSGESVIFEHVDSIDRIIIRVTGGDVTTIDGAISASNGADVCIVNPAGVVFSSNASMSTVDTLHVSPADYLDFSAGDTDRFLADDSQSNVFSTAPVAFGFLGAPGGNISVDGASLTVAADKTLSLIGGDLLVDNGATLTAESGRVNLMSVASTGEVDISGTDPVMNGVTAQGDVTIRASSKIDVNGDGGGRVFIRGGNVVLENASIEAKTTGATAGQGVDIAASNALTFTHSLIDTATGGTGNGGNVALSAADITLDASGASADEVFIDTRTDGLADAGNITLTATNSITLDATGASARIRIHADSLAVPGLAGDIALNANSIVVQGQALFSLSSTATDAASIGSIGATAPTTTVDGQEGSLLVDKTGVGGFYVITNVILDGSLGPARSVAGPAYTVQEAWGTVSGANLFHSAKKFIVDSGESVIFEHVVGIDRIIIRVTGGDVTTIDGAISASNGADVCIVNPAGVVFSSNASMSTVDTLHVSTADYLDFSAGDTDRFLANDSQSNVFSTAPVAFGFLGAPGGNISVDGASLTVAADMTLSLIGGDLLMDNGATLTAGSGRVNLMSVASTGEVDISGTDPVMNGVTAQGELTIRASSEMDVNGLGGGRAFIRGGNVVLQNASVEAETTGATAGLGVDIAASNALTFTHSLIDTSTGGAGNGGNVFLSAADMTLDASGASADAVFIDTRTDGAGNAGNITLTATNSITLDASGASVQIGIFADSLATPGEAGDIALNANAIIVQEEGLFLLSSTAADGASIGSIDATASTITVDGHEGILRVDVTGKGGFYVFTNVILDGSLGPARSVGGPAYTVLEAWGTISGANLFHSFEKLVIEPGESIAFEHSGPIERIIVRVTDGEVFSNDGEISSSSGADVYIINPAGVAFTSNTSLGTIGALHVSTADYVDFSAGDTDRFFADDAESTVFSAAPVAFGFLNASVANIPVDGASLTVPADKTVSLIGGDISVHNGATLTAASGRVNLVSVASAGEVDMSGADPDASSFSTLGSVDIQGSSINTSTLFVAADDVAIDGASILTVATAATLNTGGICAGPITGAGTLTKEGDGVLTLSHGNNTYAGATTVEAGTLNVTGTLTDSVVTVNSGATLQGTGNIGGGVTVAAGATLTPGEGAGILSTGDLALNGGATFTVELNGITVGNDYDQVDVTGAVNLGGATLDLAVGFTPSYGPIAFTIVNNDGSDPVVNAFSNLGEGSVFTSGENHFRITYRGGDGNDVVLTYFRLQVPYILLLDDPEPIRPPRR